MTPPPPDKNRRLPIARVLINLGLDRPFDYRIPDHLLGKISSGMKVNVPFGKGKSLRPAYVTAVLPDSPFPDLKELDSLCDGQPKIPDNLLRLGDWIASYYCCSREHATRCLLPGAVRHGKIRAKKIPRFYLENYELASDYIANATPKTQARAEILKRLLLRPGASPEQLLSQPGASRSALDGLVKLKLVKKELATIQRDPFKGVKIQKSEPLTPTEEQAAALRQIFTMSDHPGEPHVLLLHGVTCSGKTEVYLQAIAHILESDGDAIVLVPEISLTPQTVTRFKSRFGDRVSVLHSGLSDGERYDEWMKVHSGEVKIAVGARSALFAPFTNLKLIIVDEEHEQSYKQSETPRYHARDVAVMRGKMENALVILGSATPSFESFTNAKTGKYALASMRKRSDPGLVLPDVKIVDMRLEIKDNDKIPFLSKALIDAVHARIRGGEQCILFLNKRGYANRLICECGYQAMCPDCTAPFTYHKKNASLTCHLCGSAMKAPDRCPECASDKIRYSGAGTERIESMVTDFFKGARIARMDSDTMTKPERYEQVFSEFRQGKLDILIGTQMIAKGLDFPNVTLVGIINADIGLNLPDFRAPERTFQLLAQVAGRTGRGLLAGEVIVQTFCPYNPAIQCAAEHDFISFYESEIPIREELHLPPDTHLSALHFDGGDPDEIFAAASDFVTRLRAACPSETVVTDPAPAPIEKIKNKFRFLVQVTGKNLAPARKFIRAEAMSWRKANKSVDFYPDIDALSLL